MDVTCERCSTEYEFDETLLSGRGTSVKCTNCGHVFKVYPRAAEEADRTTSSWRLRTASGSVDTIETLRELQRRISSGELTPHDEIARGDEDWKKLGSIPELGTFFQAAGVQIESIRIPSPLPPVAPNPSQSPRESSLPPGKRPRQPTLLGVSPVQRIPAPAKVPEPDPWSAPEPAPAPIQDEEALPESMPSVAGGSYRSPYTRDSLADTASIEPEDAVFEETPAASARTSTPPPAYYDDDDDIPELPGRGTSPLRWLLIIVAVGGLVLVASQWSRVATMLGIGGDPTLIAARVDEGDAAVAEGYPGAYANAIEAYGRAVEAGGDMDAEVLAKLSNAYALAAQAQLDGGATEESVRSLTEAAMSTAEAASSLDGRRLDVKLAVVDALRLAGSNEEARERLDEARAMAFSRTAELYRIDARLSAAEAGGRLENGLRSARQAVELDPDGVRYALLLARAEKASEHEDRAREALAGILAAHPEHPVATALMAEMETTEAAVDAGTAADAGTETDGGAAPVPDPSSAPPSEPAPASDPSSAEATEPEPEPAKKAAAEPAAPAKVAPPAKPKRQKPPPSEPQMDEYDRLAQAAQSDAFVDGRPPVLDYESNMKKGREELEAGNHARARAYFDSALEVHPGSAEAMDALGDVATAVNDYASALRYYRVAGQRGHPDGYFKLGQTYERLGKNEEAVSAYYTYVTRRPTGTHAEAARQAIRTLEPRAKLPPELEPDPQPDTPVESEAAPEPDASTPEDAAPESDSTTP